MASIVNVALLVGAVALLVESATRPGLRTVLGALIVIELFAFLRSPLRFVERLSAHRLGFRRGLALATLARAHASARSASRGGDRSPRAISWSVRCATPTNCRTSGLRCVIPLVTSALVMALERPRHRSHGAARPVVVLRRGPPRDPTAGRRGARRQRRSVDCGATGCFAGRARSTARNWSSSARRRPSFALLGRLDFAERPRAPRRSNDCATPSRRFTSRHNISDAVAPAMTALALGALVVRPAERRAVDRRRGAPRPRDATSHSTSFATRSTPPLRVSAGGRTTRRARRQRRERRDTVAE